MLSKRPLPLERVTVFAIWCQLLASGLKLKDHNLFHVFCMDHHFDFSPLALFEGADLTVRRLETPDR